MLKKRIIPKLQLVKDKTNAFVLNTTREFKNFRDVGHPISQAKIYQANNVDELMFLNIDSIDASDKYLVNTVNKIAKEIFTPFSVGGGISNLNQIEFLLKAGADKVSINSHALKDSNFITEASAIFGTQCIIVSIDYSIIDGKAKVAANRGEDILDLDLLDWSMRCMELGAGEINLTSIDNDGMKQGLDIENIKLVRSKINIPITVSGGCGLASHFVEGFRDGGADAVAAGTFFCLQDQTPMQCRAHVQNAGIPIRLTTCL